MKYKIFITITLFLLIESLILAVSTFPNIGLNSILIILFSISLFVLSLKTVEKYNYEKENPNALVYGRNISGTVYSSNENNTPGLGWIL
jgi:hypothetical protein